MSTITELIRSNNVRPSRKMYIKRRDSNGDYESSWVRIDKLGGKNKVFNWGTVSILIDSQEGVISSFNISNLTVQMDNSEGLFNVETDSRSIWNGFLNRKLTKLKIDAGYIDTDDTIVGEDTIFEGVIDSVKIGDNQKAVIRVLSYQNTLKGYDFSDITGLGATETVNTIIDAIMNQTKITTYIPFVASNAAANSTVTIASLSGSYWNVITDLAFRSGSVPKLVGSTWSFVQRAIGASSVWDFIGKGAGQKSDTYKIIQYDDEGADRVYTKWISSEGEAATTSDTTLRTKYPNDREIDLSIISNTSDRQDIVDELLSQYENPKPVIEVQSRFFLNQIEPLNKVTFDILGQVYPADIGRYDVSRTVVDESSPEMGEAKWGGILGSITIDSSESWMVTNVRKNINTWTTKIKAERIV